MGQGTSCYEMPYHTQLLHRVTDLMIDKHRRSIASFPVMPTRPPCSSRYLLASSRPSTLYFPAFQNGDLHELHTISSDPGFPPISQDAPISVNLSLPARPLPLPCQSLSLLFPCVPVQARVELPQPKPMSGTPPPQSYRMTDTPPELTLDSTTPMPTFQPSHPRFSHRLHHRARPVHGH